MTDTFTYLIDDDDGGTHTASLTIRVTGNDDDPVVVQTVTLSNPVLESGGQIGSGGVASTLNDSFLYDPQNPTATTPKQAFDASGQSEGHHANSATDPLSIRYEATPTTITASNEFVVDLRGRNECVSTKITTSTSNSSTATATFSARRRG